MDFSFFSAHQEGEVVELVEIKAETTSQTDERGLFLLLPSQLQPENFLGLQLVLHQAPVHHSTVRRNRVEAEFLVSLGVPSHLPNWISVLLSSDSRLVDRLIVLVADVVDEDCTVVEACS